MATEQKDATGITTLAPSYEEAVKQTAARSAYSEDWPGNPVPDTPRGVPHLNPALHPAPIRDVVPDRIPVPVINDPGLVGANPSLATLNRQHMADFMGISLDQSEGLTEKKQQTAITEAAQDGQQAIADKVKDMTDSAVSDADKASKGVEADDKPKPAVTKPSDAAK